MNLSYSVFVFIFLVSMYACVFETDVSIFQAIGLSVLVATVSGFLADGMPTNRK